MDSLLHDLRYAIRALCRTPGFTCVAVLTLALGIGANTAMFSVVHAVLLQPLPFPESDRLVRIWSTMQAQGVPRGPSALPDYRVWRADNHTFLDMGAYLDRAYNLTAVDHPERLQGTRITASIWSVLRARPQLGNLFVSDTEQWGRHRIVVISETLWRRSFAADPAVVGRTIRLDDENYTIVGVMAASFEFPSVRTELWTPISYAPGDTMDSRSNHVVDILGRLKAGTTLSQAQADLSVIAEQIRRQTPENAGIGVTSAEWREFVVGDVRSVLLLLLGAVGFVLLIACANVANLLLARSAIRQKELSLRVALGAGRRRLLRQLLTESLVIAGLGALLGSGLAFSLVHLLPLLASSGLPRFREVSVLNETVLGFTAGLTVLTALACGIWPAWHASASDVNEHLKESARNISTARTHGRIQSLLIVVEVALSLVLLVGAALLILSLAHVQRVDPGFRPDNLLTMRVNLPRPRYSTPERIESFVDQTLMSIAALPGIPATGATSALPLGQSEWGKNVRIEGRPSPSSLAEMPIINYRQVSPDYLRALGATLRRGRFFTIRDDARQPGVVIINETLARRFWPGENPVGERISLGPPISLIAHLLSKDFSGFPWLTIVGVVGDLRHNGPELEPKPEVFAPIAQAGEEKSPAYYLIARTVAEPLGYAQAIQAVIHRVDPNQPIADVLAMNTRLANSLARRRFTMLLLGIFATLAVVLALVGLYGVMTYLVGRRIKEIGIRTALGAEPRHLFHLVVGQGLRLAFIGVGLGLLLGAELSRLIAGQLFQVSAFNPTIYATTSALLLTCAVLASALPARRAMSVDPIVALRYE